MMLLLKVSFSGPVIVIVSWDGTELFTRCLPQIPVWGSAMHLFRSNPMEALLLLLESERDG